MIDKVEHWQVKKEIPLALILSLALVFIGQSFGFGWYASGQSARVSELERAQVAIEKKLELVSTQAERLVRVETKMDGLSVNMVELKDILRQRPRQ